MIPGLNQVQVNVKAGLTFASSLRSILRQDPDVIMVGEIRDKETAEISIKAAQTGHLVLSTLHTNDSVGAITRLLDIGVPVYQIAAAVTGIVAQRVIRRLCSCHRIILASPEFVSRMMLLGVRTPPESQSVPTGCDACDLTGYKGRIGIYEILVLNDAIREAVREGGRNDQTRARARRRGMRLMHEYALGTGEVRHCLAGVGVGVEFVGLSPKVASQIDREIKLCEQRPARRRSTGHTTKKVAKKLRAARHRSARLS